MIVGFCDECGFSFDDLIVFLLLSGLKFKMILYLEDGSEVVEWFFIDFEGLVN